MDHTCGYSTFHFTSTFKEGGKKKCFISLDVQFSGAGMILAAGAGPTLAEFP